MARPEYRSLPSGLQPEIAYSDTDQKLYGVALASSRIFFEYYRLGKHSNPEVARRVLKDSLTFIHNARTGLANNPNQVDRLGLATPEDLRLAQTIDGGPTVTDDEELEALRFSLITMGAIPQLSTVSFQEHDGEYHDFRFTKTGMMAPPETLVETSQRLRELWMETFKVAEGNSKPRLHIIEDQSKLRAYFFWKTAAQIAIEA